MFSNQNNIVRNDSGEKGLQAHAQNLVPAAAITSWIAAVYSPCTKRAYGIALAEFFTWHAENGQPELTKATVNTYKVHLVDRELAPSDYIDITIHECPQRLPDA